ncbi:MAG: SDR family NAD(P)-dependent oxidoreductase, partial [Planctomycetota bacterium]
MELKGAKALVTGGSEGIGRGIAAALRREGCDVVIPARRREPLERAAEELGVDGLVGDVGDEADAVRVVKSFVDRQGRIDILVNNAGIGHFAPLVEMDTGKFFEVYRTNVFGAF